MYQSNNISATLTSDHSAKAIRLSVTYSKSLKYALKISVYMAIPYYIIEPPHDKTNNLHRQTQRRSSASRLPRS